MAAVGRPLAARREVAEEAPVTAFDAFGRIDILGSVNPSGLAAYVTGPELPVDGGAALG